MCRNRLNTWSTANSWSSRRSDGSASHSRKQHYAINVVVNTCLTVCRIFSHTLPALLSADFCQRRRCVTKGVLENWYRIGGSWLDHNFSRFWKMDAFGGRHLHSWTGVGERKDFRNSIFAVRDISPLFFRTQISRKFLEENNRKFEEILPHYKKRELVFASDQPQ